jgi:BirA family biotin operon repressor/biotin-[acetyl-CoA-carboxylase] ligase
VLPAPHLEWSARLGRSCWFHEHIGSTNDEAFALARAGAPHGSLVLADAQSAGRGRLGRSWFSPPGLNLYFSVILRPQTAPAETALITLAAGVAIAETLGLRLKWPNDVVDPGFRKVAGLLSEMDVVQGAVAFVVLGVGLNVNQPDFPADLPEAASLRMLLGEPLDRAAVLAGLLPALERRVTQIRDERAAVLEAWAGLSALGERTLRAGELEGVAVGLRPDGALLLRDAEGRIHPVLAGDVLPVPS